MKTLLVLSFTLFACIAIAFCVSLCHNDILTYENVRLKAMVDSIVSYSDSTDDTGEFDDFIDSKQGQEFFKTYNELYKGE